MALLAALVGCNLFVDPTSTGGTLVAITNVYHGRVSVVDVTARRHIGQRGDSLLSQGAPGVSPDSTIVYYTGAAGGLRTLIALDVRGNRILMKRPTRLAGYPNPDGGGPVKLFAPSVLAPLSSGDFLWYPAVENNRTGLALYRPETDTLLRFLPIYLFTGHTQVLRGVGIHPRGSLVIGGSRNEAPRPVATEFYVISHELQVLDSVALPSGSEVFDVVMSPDERVAFVKSRTHLLKIDLGSRQVVASVPSNIQGSLAIAPRGDVLLLTDLGLGLSVPSSGSVFLYASDLQSLGRIDLQPQDPRGPPPTTWDAVFSADGREAYVTAGTPSITFGQTGQPASVFVVNIANQRAVGRIHLWNGGGTPSIRTIK